MDFVDRLMGSPWVYRVWQLPQARAKFAPIVRFNDLTTVRSVLDLGCGPGTNARYFSRVNYHGIDCSQRCVDFARRRYGPRFAVADLRDAAVAWPRAFDFVLVNSLLHHLRDDDVHSLLGRITSALTADGHVHILDLVAGPPDTLAGRLSRLDRGAFARPMGEWRRMFETYFEPAVVHPYAVTCCGVPLWHMVYFKGRVRI